MSDANAPDDSRVLAELQARLESMPPIPAQGAGPHVEFDGNGHLVPARPGAVDPDGNNVALLASLLPQLIQVTDELHVLLLPQGNVAHDRLRRRLEALRAHLVPDLAQVKRDWLVFEGVRFLNAERANREAIRTGNEPAHGEDAREALDTLATLLPAFAMATAQGPALLRAEDVWQREPSERAAYRAALHDVALAAKADSERPPDERVISPEVAEAMLGATTEAGDGSNPTRTWVLGETLTGNVTAALVLGASVGAATLGLASFGPAGTVAGVAVGLLFGKGLEQSKPFVAARGALTQLIDRAMLLDASPAAALLERRLGAIGGFVAGTGPRLRRLGEMGGALSWVSRSLEWLAARPGGPDTGPQPDGFSIEEVKRRILAGEAIPSAWLLYIHELDFSVEPLGILRPGESESYTQTRLWASLGSAVLESTAALASLTHLTTLCLAGTKALDLTPLAGIAGLRYLDLRGTRVTDLAPLAGIAGLQYLNLGRTLVTDLAPLAGITGMQHLIIERTRIADLAPLVGISGLQILDIRSTPVFDLAPLAGIARLQTLYMSNTLVIDLAPLASIAGLQAIDLSITPVTDLAPLAKLTDLESLDLGGTQVTDLAPLAGIIDLTGLSLNGTPVTDLAPLAGIVGLRMLDLSATQVTDLAPLAGIAGLQTLDISDTKVTNLAPLADLPSLDWLTLTGLPEGIEDVLPSRAGFHIFR
jgi:Leucine-rich repeat (LRR) protein